MFTLKCAFYLKISASGSGVCLLSQHLGGRDIADLLSSTLFWSNSGIARATHGKPVSKKQTKPQRNKMKKKEKDFSMFYHVSCHFAFNFFYYLIKKPENKTGYLSM